MGRIRFGIWVAMAFMLAPLAGAQSYTVTNLGNLGAPGGGALAVNNHGEVAGVSNTASGNEHAFFWTSTKGMRDLGVLPGDNDSYAQGLNDSEQVVGWSVNSTTGTIRAFIWSAKTGMQDLGGLGGELVIACAINESGAVVGYSNLSDGNAQHAFLWTAAGGMQDLGTLGGNTSIAGSINGSGEVVGTGWLPGDVSYHAFLWTQIGGMQDLGTLGNENSGASGINGEGHVVGTVTTKTGEQAFIWTPAHGMQFLNGIPQKVSLTPAAINDSDEIVGYDGNRPQSAFVWQKPNRLYQLFNLLPPNSSANGINDARQIAATDVSLGAILLTPVEP
jgi:probable HAF family extracellular repeat protein